MRLANIIKQPGEYKDYTVDYSPWLIPMEDTIDEVICRVECLTDPEDTSLEIPEHPEYTEREIKLWAKGGTAGYRYKATITVHTVVGRVDESELIFKIKDY